MQACGQVGVGELLRQPALEPDRGELRRQFDDQHRISEAPERFRAVTTTGDKQERQARDQPHDEAEEI